MQRQVASFANRSRYQNHKNTAIENPFKCIVKTMNVNIANIHMADYQRTPNSNRIRKIMNEYDPHRDRPIEVSYRDGKYWCFDGQHRTRVHELMGNETILAQVHYGLTYHDEAALFARQHENVQSINSKDRWNAAVASGTKSPEVREIIRMCKEAGFEISTESFKVAKADTFGCVCELQKLYKKHGKNGFVTMLWLINTAWPNQPEMKQRTHREIVAGICKLMDTFNMDDRMWNKLQSKLSKEKPDVFLTKANTAQGRGGKRVAIRMVGMINSGLAHDNPRRLNEYLIK